MASIRYIELLEGSFHGSYRPEHVPDGTRGPSPLARRKAQKRGQQEKPSHLTWRFMGSYKWGSKSPNIGYNYSYPSSNPPYP